MHHKIDIRQITSHLDTILSAYNSFPIIICSDTNARNTLWNDRLSNTRGNDLADWLIDNALHILNNNDSLSYHESDCSSFIDLKMVNERMLELISDWHMDVNKEILSDHELIRINISCNNKPIQNKNIPQILNHRVYNTCSADWNKFKFKLLKKKHEIDKRLNNIKNSSDIGATLDYVIWCIQSTAESCIPLIKPGNSRRGFRFDAELTRTKKKTERSKRLKQRSSASLSNTQDENRQNYLTNRNVYRQMITHKKNDYWRNFCSSTTRKTLFNIYRIVSNVNTGQISTIQKEDGSYTTSLYETMSYAIESFYPTANGNHPLPFLSNYYSPYACPIFTPAEIIHHASSIKTKKAPGLDNLTANIIRQSIFILTNQFTQLYNTCLIHCYFPKLWKAGSLCLVPKPVGQISTIKKFRSISLLPVLDKIFEKLLDCRLAQHLYSTKQLSLRQYGFRRQKSTTDALAQIVKILSSSLENKYVSIVVSLDISGAFNHASWHLIIHQLIKKMCPYALLGTIRSFFQQRHITYTNANINISKKLSQGCPQGSCLAPGPWNVLLDSTLRIFF